MISHFENIVNKIIKDDEVKISAQIDEIKTDKNHLKAQEIPKDSDMSIHCDDEKELTIHEHNEQTNSDIEKIDISSTNTIKSVNKENTKKPKINHLKIKQQYLFDALRKNLVRRQKKIIKR